MYVAPSQDCESILYVPSDDGRIRKVVVRVHRDGKNIEYTRPISELVVLIEH